MELSNSQKNIVETTDSKVVVMSCAGSGKTRCLTERVKTLLSRGADPTKMVVITFTNAAAEEMKDRIGDKGKDVFIGTVHSYANYILSCSGYDTRKYLDKEKFDELFDMVKRHEDCIREVDNLLLDEAQDSTDQQFEFIIDLINPKSFFIVGDIRQSIYSFNGANPDYFYNLSCRSDVKTYDLIENYRNSYQILNYAKDFLEPLGYKYYDDSRALNKNPGSVYRIEYNAANIGRYILDSEDNFGDWFVLARTNALVDELWNTLTSMGIPCETFKKAELSNKELNEKMKNNTVKILTIHTSKGLENKNVVVAGAQYYNNEERRINYVAATRAINTLFWCTVPKRKKRTRYSDIDSWE